MDNAGNFANRSAQITQTEDRSNLIQDMVSLTLETIHGLQRVDDQRMSNVLGGLVRSKLLSADDSYALKDRLNDLDIFKQALDNRIEAALKRNGIMNDDAIAEFRKAEIAASANKRPI